MVNANSNRRKTIIGVVIALALVTVPVSVLAARVSLNQGGYALSPFGQTKFVCNLGVKDIFASQWYPGKWVSRVVSKVVSTVPSDVPSEVVIPDAYLQQCFPGVF